MYHSETMELLITLDEDSTARLNKRAAEEGKTMEEAIVALITEATNG